MALDTEFPIPTAATVLAAAQAMDQTTPSLDIYELIAVAERLADPPPHLIGLLAKRTGVAAGSLRSARARIARHFTFSRATEVEALALDALEKHFGFGEMLKVGTDRTLYMFTGTHWAGSPDHNLRRALSEMVMQRPLAYGTVKSAVGPAISLIKDLAPPADDFMLAVPPPVVNTRNAELWVSPDGELEPRIHRPESGLRYVLPVDYDPKATSPIFDTALAEIFSKADEPAEVIRHTYELMGYGTQGVRDIPVIGFLCGSGANGKSLLLGIVKTLVGREQVLAGTLGAVTGDRFMLPNLADKLLFVEDDAKDNVELADGLLKMLTENKIIDTRRVRSSHGMSFCSMVMPLIATNNAPRLHDTSDGMRRRLHVIPFQRQFTREEIDPDLGRKIVTAELSGVLNHLVEGLQRLRARGRFDPPADCERAKDAFLASANPLLGFIEERCVAAPGKRVALGDFHQAYVVWMKQGGQKPDLPLRSLKPKLQAMGYNVTKASHLVVHDVILRDA